MKYYANKQEAMAACEKWLFENTTFEVYIRTGNTGAWEEERTGVCAFVQQEGAEGPEWPILAMVVSTPFGWVGFRNSAWDDDYDQDVWVEV